jgi:hypothetical protein
MDHGRCFFLLLHKHSGTVTFTRLFITQNDSTPQNSSGQDDNAVQDSAAREAARKKRREERKKKKQEEEARKKKKLQEQQARAKQDSIKKAQQVSAQKTQPADITRDTSQAITTTAVLPGDTVRQGNFDIQPRPRPNDMWLFALLFTVYAIYVSLRVLYSKRFRQEIRAFFTSRTVSQMMREEYALSNRVSIGLSLLFILLFSLFLYQVFAYYGYFNIETYPPVKFYFSIVGLVIVLFALKLLLVRLLGVVFRVEGAVNEYIFNIFLHHKALGIFLFPVTIALAFVRDVPPRHLIAAGWCIVGLVLLYRTLRTTVGGIQAAGISKYYLFLYLCTLEILPLIVIIKVFISQT